MGGSQEGAGDGSEADQSTNQLGSELTTQQEAIKVKLDEVSASIEQLEGRSVAANEAWQLSEIEQLLAMANNSVQFGDNHDQAKAALTAAKTRLIGMSSDKYAAVQQAISDDLSALDKAGTTDILAVAQKIDSLTERTQDLVLQGDTLSAGESITLPTSNSGTAIGENSWLSTGKGILSDLGKMVQIEKHGEMAKPALNSGARQTIAHKTKIMLETARYALLKGDQSALTGRLQATQEWAQSNYEADDAAVKPWLDDLESIVDVQINAVKPDVSTSLEQLRQLMKSEG
jgi:uroporphyrin-3 C-methyltransferase